MKGPFAMLAAISMLLGCASNKPSANAYDKGVEAYRTKDYASARVYWNSAAEAGNTSALNNLGYLLYFGLGGDRDYQRALSLWRRAAFAGHPEAQWHLGQTFEEGKAVPRDLVEAYAWYRCSVANAESSSGANEDLDARVAADARKSLVNLLKKLTKDQFDNGERLAGQYIEKYAKNAKPAPPLVWPNLSIR